MSIYEELYRKDNEFVLGQGMTTPVPRLPRMPVLDANQPTRIVSFTAPEKRPSIESLNLAPPFDRFFIEASLPSEMQRLSCTNSLMSARGRVQDIVLRQPITAIAMDVQASEFPYTKAVSEAGFGSVRWSMRCSCFYDIVHTVDPLCLSNYEFLVFLGEDGFPIRIPAEASASLEAPDDDYTTEIWVGADGSHYSVFCAHRQFTEQEFAEMEADERAAVRDRMRNELREFLPLFYAINSLHSKRTEIVTVPVSRQQRRHAARSGGQQPADHRTIKVKDYIRIYGEAQKARREGSDYPLHEVIGHFRSYGVNGRKGLLFGKYAGTFFVPSFLKGNPDVGATDHDYRLTA